MCGHFLQFGIDCDPVLLFTPPSGCKTSKLFWTSALEGATLKFNLQAVPNGKRSDKGFKPETHYSILSNLNSISLVIFIFSFNWLAFMNNFFFIQGLKKDYDKFLELKNASGLCGMKKPGRTFH
ncbi:uncharacterized protein VP01_3730g7 [Puccinia sorghi]|uniref:Uncharacterized protein n=1 Tax=Puccinia sorghi TaxID=27349 RepID=A0A0L6UTZ6_9BASI|nr:uncharacterized protein VP01_3730g7 [Puccinia sorghi]